MARTLAHAEALAEKLRALPAIENKTRPISKAEEIKLLAGEIATLQQRNYSLQQIAQFLTGEGLGISTATLKNYLQRSKAAGKRPTKKRAITAPTGAVEPHHRLPPRQAPVNAQQHQPCLRRTRIIR